MSSYFYVIDNKMIQVLGNADVSVNAFAHSISSFTIISSNNEFVLSEKNKDRIYFVDFNSLSDYLNETHKITLTGRFFKVGSINAIKTILENK